MAEERSYITHIVDQDNPEVKHYFKDLSAEEAISTLESSSHKHENTEALNKITNDKIDEWDNKLNEIVIEDNSITKTKIQDGAVTLSKLGDDVKAIVYKRDIQMLNPNSTEADLQSFNDFCKDRNNIGKLCCVSYDDTFDGGNLVDNVYLRLKPTVESSNLKLTVYNEYAESEVLVTPVDGMQIMCDDFYKDVYTYNSSKSKFLKDIDGSDLNINIFADEYPSSCYLICDEIIEGDDAFERKIKVKNINTEIDMVAGNKVKYGIFEYIFKRKLTETKSSTKFSREESLWFKLADYQIYDYSINDVPSTFDSVEEFVASAQGHVLNPDQTTKRVTRFYVDPKQNLPFVWIVGDIISIANKTAVVTENAPYYMILENPEEVDLSGVTSQINTLDEKLNTVLGSDTNKTIRGVASEEVAKIVAGAPDNLNTLKEIADWIATDTTGSAEMANDISELKTTTSTLTNNNQIILPAGFQITQTVGALSPKKLEEPMSLIDLLKTILCKEAAGTLTKSTSDYGLNFSVKIQNGSTTSDRSFEVGTKITVSTNPYNNIKYTANNNFYTYYTDAEDKTTYTDLNTKTLTPNKTKPDSVNETWELTDGFSKNVSGTFTYNFNNYKTTNVTGIGIQTNLGTMDIKSTLKKLLSSSEISGSSSLTSSSDTITSFRKVFYGVYDSISGLDSDKIRGLAKNIKNTSTGANPAKFSLASNDAGKSYLLVAVPAGYKVSEFKSFQGALSLDVTFSKLETQIPVKGANGYTTTDSGNNTVNGYKYNIYYSFFPSGTTAGSEYQFKVVKE